jgi:hypothetical protein
VTLLPDPIAALSDDDLLAAYTDGAEGTADGGWLRVNFVSSLDGSATAAGKSGSLGGDDDLRVFDLLRRVADVVLVAAGTVRDEGYGPMVLHDADVAWRRAHGMSDHPVFAIVTGSLGLDPASRVFTEAPVRPLVLTSAPAARRRRRPLTRTGVRPWRPWRTSSRAARTPSSRRSSAPPWSTGDCGASTARVGRRSSVPWWRPTWSTSCACRSTPRSRAERVGGSCTARRRNSDGCGSRTCCTGPVTCC